MENKTNDILTILKDLNRQEQVQVLARVFDELENDADEERIDHLNEANKLDDHLKELKKVRERE